MMRLARSAEPLCVTAAVVGIYADNRFRVGEIQRGTL